MFRHPPLNHDQVLALYNQGLSDQEVANGLPEVICSAWKIREWRKINNLPANNFGQRHREKLAKAKKEQIKEEGITLGRKNRANECIRSLDLGWNTPLTKAERRVAQCLLDGEKTIHELRLLTMLKLTHILSRMRKDGLIRRRRVFQGRNSRGHVGHNQTVFYRLTENCGKDIVLHGQ